MSEERRRQDGLKSIREALGQRRAIAFIGAGVSRMAPACVPGWRECFEALCAKARDYGKMEAASRALKIAKLADFDPRYLVVAFDDIREALQEPVYHRTMQGILEPKAADDFSEALKLLVELPLFRTY